MTVSSMITNIQIKLVMINLGPKMHIIETNIKCIIRYILLFLHLIKYLLGIFHFVRGVTMLLN